MCVCVDVCLYDRVFFLYIAFTTKHFRIQSMYFYDIVLASQSHSSHFCLQEINRAPIFVSILLSYTVCFALCTTSHSRHT